MPFEGVLYRHEKVPIRIQIESAIRLPEQLGESGQAAVLVVRTAILQLLGEHPNLFFDRHVKDTRKGLANLLLGKDARVPYIDAKFSQPGRLQQSVTALLRNSVKKARPGIFILGVRNPEFEAAWKAAAEDHRKTSAGRKAPGLSGLLEPLPGEAKIAREYWGESSAYHFVRQLILRAAQSTCPVLIIGETGTGKGIVARQIHERQRPGRPFVEVNCAAIPGDLLESELFGYKEGAFTGAMKGGKQGQWEAANGGTLFLDEVGDLTPEHQKKILSALQSGIIRRVGGTTNIAVNARIIAATNRNLFGMVQAGKFREDLFYRLRQFVIFTPVLREDPEDLVLIAQKLWWEITASNTRLPNELLTDLCRHRWPGNVRELRSVLGSLYSFFGKESLTSEQLNAVFQHFGLVAGYNGHETSEDALGTLQMECLRKLRSADDSLHACEVALKPLSEGGRMSPDIRSSLMRIRNEMQFLLENHLYFGSHESYSAIALVEEGLGKLLTIPSRRAGDISSFLHDEFQPAIQRAIDRLFEELEKLKRPGASAQIESR